MLAFDKLAYTPKVALRIKTRSHHSKRPMPPTAFSISKKNKKCEGDRGGGGEGGGEGGEREREEKVSMLTHTTARGVGKKKFNGY